MFLLGFAPWFISNTYVGVSFYRDAIGSVVESILALCIYLSFAAVLIASLLLSVRKRRIEWGAPLLAAILLLIAYLWWQYVITPLPTNGFKLIAAWLDIMSPLIAILGLAAVSHEWRQLIRTPSAME